jgi:hypothetical protein
MAREPRTLGACYNWHRIVQSLARKACDRLTDSRRDGAWRCDTRVSRVADIWGNNDRISPDGTLEIVTIRIVGQSWVCALEIA